MSAGWAPYLDEGERILWEGRPSGKLFLLRSTDVFMIPFSLVWGGFALFWNVGVWVAGAPFFFSIFGLPFLVMGAYITIGRFFIDQHIRRGTVYALSDKRAFIAKSSFGRKLREMPIGPHTAMNFVPGKRATLTLGAMAGTFNDMRGLSVWHGGTGDFAFKGIENGNDVYRLVRDIQEKSV